MWMRAMTPVRMLPTCPRLHVGCAEHNEKGRPGLQDYYRRSVFEASRVLPSPCRGFLPPSLLLVGGAIGLQLVVARHLPTAS